MSDDRDILYAAIGAGFGAYTFFKGFQILRNKRLVENTPTSKCRSIALGLAEVQGKATGDTWFTSPLAEVRCYCSQLKIERYEKRGKSSRWVTVHERQNMVPFFVEDETGRVRVNPQGAELDLSPDLEYENESGIVNWLKQAFSNDPAEGFAGRSIEERFRSYCGRQGVSYSGPMRFSERNLCPDGPVYVLGMANEVRGEQDENLRVVIEKGKHHPWFFIAESSQKEVLRKLARNVWLYVFGGGALFLACLGWLVARLTNL